MTTRDWVELVWVTWATYCIITHNMNLRDAMRRFREKR